MKKIFIAMFFILCLSVYAWVYINNPFANLHFVKSTYNPSVSLINKDISSELAELPFADSHLNSPVNNRPTLKGDPYIGAGMVYYGLVYGTLSKVAVVIGSGGGFVPKIVAQAQKDMEQEGAVTYLVDAYIDVKNHKTGQNYGQPRWDKDEKTLDNLYIMIMRSSYAAHLFKKENIKIDYLHIDGDHSIKGILEDWRYYSPLLSENAIVTFHDYLSVPDVHAALEEIKKDYPNIEYIILPDSGAGTIIAQLGGLNIKGTPTKSKNEKTLLSLFNKDKKYLMMEEAFFLKDRLTSLEREDNKEFYHYLKTEKFKEIYKIIVDFIDSKDNSVVEVGGYPNSILYYLNNSKNIEVIEKYATQEWITKLSLEGMDREVNLNISPSLEDIKPNNLKNYNLVLLDFQLEYSKDQEREVIFKEVQKLFELISKANLIGLEFSDHPRSVEQLNFIKYVFQPSIVKHIRLNMNDPSTNENPNYIRNIYLIDSINPKSNWDSLENINKMVNIILSKK